MKRDAEGRRKAIREILESSRVPVAGASLAKRLSVSRQIIVSDIALLRAGGTDIVSTARGYLLAGSRMHKRIFKVSHSQEQCRQELQIFVDHGAVVSDVFVYHRIYGVVRGELNIRSRLDVEDFMERVTSGTSTLLSATTNGYHYHTILAPSEELLNRIEEALWEEGFLAKPLDHEPDAFRRDLELRA